MKFEENLEYSELMHAVAPFWYQIRALDSNNWEEAAERMNANLEELAPQLTDQMYKQLESEIYCCLFD